MKRTAAWLLVLAVMLGLPMGAADQNLVNLARPDVNLMLGIRVSEIASSPLVQTALAEAQRSNEGWNEVVGMLGPNPFSYLQEVVISGKMNPNSQDKEPEDVLMVARGSFADGEFAGLLCRQGCESEEYRDFQIFRLPKKSEQQPGYFTVLDSSHAAMGGVEEIRGLIDRRVMETESVFDASVRQGIEQLGHHHIWLTASGGFDGAVGGGGQEGGPGMMANAASKVNGFGLGVTLGHNVELALQVSSYTEQDAKQLHDMLQGFLALAKAGDAKPETKQMMENLSVRLNGTTLAASLRIPEEQIRQKIAEKAAELREQPEQAQQTVQASQPRAQKPPRREGGIRIYGLKNEPIEVPTDKQP